MFVTFEGIDGCGNEASQVFDVDPSKWIDRDHLIPFRYQNINNDLGDELRDKYFGKKTSNDKIAYYFKSFDAQPVFKQQYTDGTPIKSNLYDVERRDEIESYVELKMSISKDDMRDYFISNVGIKQAKINSISLCTAWKKTIDNYTLTPHSIFVSVIGGENEDIAKAIYNNLSAGCDYNGNTSVDITNEYSGAVETVKFYRPDVFNIFVKVQIQNSASLQNDYENIVKQAVYNNFYGLDSTKINNEPLLRLKMNDDLYSSRFTPSILNAGITNVLTVQLSLDGSEWVNNIHIPITANPTLDLNNIIIEVI